MLTRSLCVSCVPSVRQQVQTVHVCYLLKLGAGVRPPRNKDRFGKFVNFLFCTFCPIKEGFQNNSLRVPQ